MSDLLVRPSDESESAAALSRQSVFFVPPVPSSAVSFAEPINPSWLPAALRELSSFAELRPNWDGYQAAPVGLSAIATAARVLRGLPPSLRRPTLTPTAEGGISLQWQRGGHDFSLEVTESRPAVVYAQSGDRWWEGPLDEAPGFVVDAFKAAAFA